MTSEPSGEWAADRPLTSSASPGASRVPGEATVVVRGLTKHFAGTTALADVDLHVRGGTVHGLLGGNGSGKSTLIKILAGVHTADAGSIELDGQSFDVGSYSAARGRDAGLRFVHQDLGLFADMTIAENVALDAGFPVRHGAQISWRELHRSTAALLERFEVDADPRTVIGHLRPSDRTMVAIARALQGSDDGELTLVLDEPTASLPEHESKLLLESVRRRADRGQTVLLVSHRLQEVLSVADDITVLRDGRNAGTLDRAQASESAIIALIAGDTLEQVHALPTQAPPSDAAVALRLDGVAGGPLHGVDLEVDTGEVVGIAGLLGSGRSRLLRMIFGDLAPDAGRIMLGGRPLPVHDPTAAMAAGIAYVPEDRAGEALFPDMELRENVSAAVFPSYWRKGLMRSGAERTDAATLLRRFAVKFSAPDCVVTSLSGGNQQKAILARWLRREPKLLLLDEPTQGVDVVARADIYRYVRQAAAATGCAVVIVSSDFEELSTLCDRVVVLQGGRICAELRSPDITPVGLTELAQSPATP